MCTFNAAEHSIHLIAVYSGAMSVCKTLTLYLQAHYNKGETACSVSIAIFKKVQNHGSYIFSILKSTMLASEEGYLQ